MVNFIFIVLLYRPDGIYAQELKQYLKLKRNKYQEIEATNIYYILWAWKDEYHNSENWLSAYFDIVFRVITLNIFGY